MGSMNETEAAERATGDLVTTLCDPPGSSSQFVPGVSSSPLKKNDGTSSAMPNPKRLKLCEGNKTPVRMSFSASFQSTDDNERTVAKFSTPACKPTPLSDAELPRICANCAVKLAEGERGAKWIQCSVCSLDVCSTCGKIPKRVAVQKTWKCNFCRNLKKL
ncbi:uncharacterized protein LOC129598790 isoform X2 [Paramacrobiotus metropolitanus]|uniref:uncharacterized protein LOC129598790 isoform X2 n=1 Tax=Paramacrobiotus metropolitanus TaxID=2943436 RepID=UPI002445EFFA|nr:uncharacterized protein LOC129598790 isoform X2 [Paramacrobiotus metropolitanus]